jgi:hypothetical protein
MLARRFGECGMSSKEMKSDQPAIEDKYLRELNEYLDRFEGHSTNYTEQSYS